MSKIFGIVQQAAATASSGGSNPPTFSAAILVIGPGSAGGDGAGNNIGGGGGAGRFHETSAVTISSGVAYTVTVGAGGDYYRKRVLFKFWFYRYCYSWR